jgi:hypothetical protein
MIDKRGTKVPQRIQRKRTKGWRAPPNTVYVGRGSVYGNAFHWDLYKQAHGVTEREAKQWAKSAFEAVWTEHADTDYRKYLEAIKGRDLACWCKPDEPCHGDVLLKLANRHDDAGQGGLDP